KFARVTIVLLLPGSILWFGLESFRNWYAELYLVQRHKTEFEQFLQTYDTVNGTGMITYLWLSGTAHRPVDFKAQPDSTWAPNSWILNNLTGGYKPNPAIWGTLYFWHFNFP
ncbi:MAG TPA: hypothetical protein VMT57_01505, partial [Candidatus Thermoplasmatota archaeon]|nr:hypothetical protein [Candidatus Thermoplasmatota archaeon]